MSGICDTIKAMPNDQSKLTNIAKAGFFDITGLPTKLDANQTIPGSTDGTIQYNEKIDPNVIPYLHYTDLEGETGTISPIATASAAIRTSENSFVVFYPSYYNASSSQAGNAVVDLTNGSISTPLAGVQKDKVKKLPNESFQDKTYTIYIIPTNTPMRGGAVQHGGSLEEATAYADLLDLLDSGNENTIDWVRQMLVNAGDDTVPAVVPTPDVEPAVVPTTDVEPDAVSAPNVGNDVPQMHSDFWQKHVNSTISIAPESGLGGADGQGNNTLEEALNELYDKESRYIWWSGEITGIEFNPNTNKYEFRIGSLMDTSPEIQTTAYRRHYVNTYVNHDGSTFKSELGNRIFHNMNKTIIGFAPGFENKYYNTLDEALAVIDQKIKSKANEAEKQEVRDSIGGIVYNRSDPVKYTIRGTNTAQTVNNENLYQKAGGSEKKEGEYIFIPLFVRKSNVYKINYN